MPQVDIEIEAQYLDMAIKRPADFQLRYLLPAFMQLLRDADEPPERKMRLTLTLVPAE